jgi:hypothetical protein
MRKIFLAGEEPQERPPLLRAVIADGAAQHGIAGLECVEDRTLRDRTLDFELDLTADVRQCTKVLRKFDSNHDSFHRGFLNVQDFPVRALMNPDFTEDAVRLLHLASSLTFIVRRIGDQRAART